MGILETKGIKKSFGGVTAVRGVDLQVEGKEIYSVIGPNGAGKTTLFNLISGFYKCDEGRVLFKGVDITNMAPEKIVQMGMGRSFQVTSIFPRLTVLENIQATFLVTAGQGLSLFSDASKMALHKAEELLSLVGLLDKREELAGTLPAGDRKKLELGIVLATRPEMLLLDEPTCGMSPVETTGTIDLIRKIAREMSLAVLLTEHKMDVVFSVSSHITVMNFGVVIAAGKPEEIRNNKLVQDIYFGRIMMLLELSRINTFYDVFQAIFDVSIEVDRGEIVCLLGRNGAGKTTTLSSIVGLNKPRSGSIKFKGEEISGKDSYGIARKGVCMVPENRLIFTELTVKENLELGARHKSRKAFQGKLSKTYEMFPRLEQLHDRMGGDLSGGEQQMLTIARSLMADPELLLLDELSIGLAPIVIHMFKKQITRLKEENLTILLTEQNALFALDISDRAYVIDKGGIVYHGSVEELRTKKDLMREYLGV